MIVPQPFSITYLICWNLRDVLVNSALCSAPDRLEWTVNTPGRISG
jgi:hypothetical protein